MLGDPEEVSDGVILTGGGYELGLALCILRTLPLTLPEDIQRGANGVKLK